MIAEKEKAVALTTANQNVQQKESYRIPDLLSRRQAKIKQRLSKIPQAYKRNYQNAVQGKSLRAAVNAFCIECTGWQRNEIIFCTSLACPLYAVRPYQEGKQNRCNEAFSGVESKNNERGYIG
jgi:hypothetical protein